MSMQQNDRNDGFDMKRGFNLLCVAAAAHKATIVPFTRKGFGSDYPGWNGLYGFLLLVVIVAFGRTPALLCYLLAWLVVLAMRRAEAAIMRRKGWFTHSHYEGQSFLTTRWRLSEGMARKVEAALCLVMGMVIGLMAQTGHLPGSTRSRCTSGWASCRCPLATGFSRRFCSDGCRT